jgi:pimeloyl-ACP methyl ester carboxylesterase
VHAHAGAIEAGIAGSKRVVISDAGHLMYLEKPEEFSHQVIAFIESNHF